jgi:hypothetical protein
VEATALPTLMAMASVTSSALSDVLTDLRAISRQLQSTTTAAAHSNLLPATVNSTATATALFPSKTYWIFLLP